MPSIVNPMDALVSFEPALRSGAIDLHAGHLDRSVFVHVDSPAGEPRYTYCRLQGRNVTALAIIGMAEPNQGLPCFQLGYAVPEHMRGQGRAKDIAAAAIAEFRAGLGRHGIKAFYMEAVVGADNVASQRVAEAVIGGEANPIIDEHSGEAALQYIAKITTD